LRDRTLLSVAYDTGLRASELVAIAIADIVEALDPDARLLEIARSKGDQEGEGATAYLPAQCNCTDPMVARGRHHAGPVFRRVIVRRYAAKPAIAKQGWGDKVWNTRWVPAWEKGREARPARVE